MLTVTVRKLTAAFVKTAKAEPDAERSIYWDEALSGFGLMVTNAGHRSYVAQYRSHGQSRRYTIGYAAKIDLDHARKHARRIFGKVADGVDPIVEKRKAAEADRHSLRAVCESYLAREGGKLRTTERRRATLARLVYPKLGTRQINDLRRLEIVHLLDSIEDDSGPAMADQVLATLRRILNWHATRSNEFNSPIVRGMSRRDAEAGERSRILTDDELRAVWKTAESYGGPWGQFIRFLLLTATRRNEAAGMAWAELSGDEWTIPALRYKTNTEVTLPLSSAAMRVLEQIPRIGSRLAEGGCDFVFTSDGRTPIAGFSGRKMKFDIACGVHGWRLHDLRRTARSLMSRAGVNPDVAERCLGHRIAGVRGTYDRHGYLAEMKHGFEALAAQIERVVNPPGDNVVLLKEVPA
jgi:integrase